jgi:hypothetical protein
VFESHLAPHEEISGSDPAAMPKGFRLPGSQ